MADATMVSSLRRSLQFSDDDIPADTTALTVFWHIVSAIIWMCVLYQIYKSRHRRLHASPDPVWDHTGRRNIVNSQSQSPHLIALTDEEILQRQVELIEQASKRRQQMLHRFEKDQTIMTVKETDFRSKTNDSMISNESEDVKDNSGNDIETGAGHQEAEGGTGSNESNGKQAQEELAVAVNVHETAEGLSNSVESKKKVEDSTPGTEIADDGSVNSRNSMNSEAGIIEAEPGKELLVLRQNDSSQSSTSSQSPDAQDSQQGNDPMDDDVVANGCVICLEPYLPGDTVVWSINQKCVHAFHRECLIEYFQAANKDNWVLRTDEENNNNDTTSEFTDTFCPCCRQDFFPRPSAATASSTASTPGATNSAATAPSGANSHSTTAEATV